MLASLFFYGWWNWKFVPLLCLISIICWGSALWLQNNRDPFFLKIAVLLLLAPLIYFKYTYFSIHNLDLILGTDYTVEWNLEKILLPVGISFFTFQAIAYVVDVHARRIHAEPSPMLVICFVSFFPQLVAGPIERGAKLLPQLKSLGKKIPSSESINRGIFMITLGMFIKNIIADNLAEHVDLMFNSVENMDIRNVYTSAYDAILAIYFFSVQIYCDFYGYTLIALGSARLLGVNLTQNFAHPYFSTNIQEFWRRWHITLTRFFRDYVYIPLGGNRHGITCTTFNLLVVLFLVGLWHGAAYTFIAWGAVHGFMLAIHRLFDNVAKNFPKFNGYRQFRSWQIASWFITFHAVTVTWVLFRAPTIDHAQALLAYATDVDSLTSFVHINYQMAFYFTCLAAFIIIAVADAKLDLGKIFARASLEAKAAFLIIFALTTYISAPNDVPFIYFQF